MVVAVSGINDTDNPGPGVGIARSLKEADSNIEIIGISYDVNDPGNYMDMVIDKSYIFPYPSKGWSGIKERIEYIKNQKGVDFIIPSLDAELSSYIKYQDEINTLGIKTFLPTKKQFDLRSKENLESVSNSLNIIYPKIIKVSSVKELEEACKKIGFPVVIKGNYYKAHIVKNAPQALQYYTEISNEWGFPILVQEVVEGEELNVVGVGDGEGGDLGMVAMKKLTTTSIGKVWNAITIKNSLLLKTAKDFVEKYQWRGPFELECIVKRNQIFLIEINPRFPAWVYFASGVGINLPYRLISFMNNQEVDRGSNYDAGKLFIRYTYEKISDISHLANLSTIGESL